MLREFRLQSLFTDERFRVVPETMVDGLIVIDAGGIIQYVNPGCEKLFGYESADIIGKNVAILMPEPYSSAHDGYITRHRETRVKRIIGIGRELTGRKADGSIFPMYLSVGEAETPQGAIFVGIIYDLTEKKRAEETILHHRGEPDPATAGLQPPADAAPRSAAIARCRVGRVAPPQASDWREDPIGRVP